MRTEVSILAEVRTEILIKRFQAVGENTALASRNHSTVSSCNNLTTRATTVDTAATSTPAPDIKHASGIPSIDTDDRLSDLRTPRSWAAYPHLKRQLYIQDGRQSLSKRAFGTGAPVIMREIFPYKPTCWVRRRSEGVLTIDYTPSPDPRAWFPTRGIDTASVEKAETQGSAAKLANNRRASPAPSPLASYPRPPKKYIPVGWQARMQNRVPGTLRRDHETRSLPQPLLSYASKLAPPRQIDLSQTGFGKKPLRPKVSKVPSDGTPARESSPTETMTEPQRPSESVQHTEGSAAGGGSDPMRDRRDASWHRLCPSIFPLLDYPPASARVYCEFYPFFLARTSTSIMTVGLKQQVESNVEDILRRIQPLMMRSCDESLSSRPGLSGLTAKPVQSIDGLMDQICLQMETPDIGPLKKFIGFSVLRSLESIATPGMVSLSVFIGGKQILTVIRFARRGRNTPRASNT